MSCRTENAAETEVYKLIEKNILDIFGHFWLFGSLARLNNDIEPSQKKQGYSPTSV